MAHLRAEKPQSDKACMMPAMRALIFTLVTVLAGCANGGEGPTPGPAPGSITARFPPGQAEDIIQVTVVDRLPTRAVELIGPNGVVQPAYALIAGGVSVPRSGSVGAIGATALGSVWNFRSRSAGCRARPSS
jgi:hypothetical protein